MASQPKKDPPPTAAEQAEARAFVISGIHAACPALKPEGGVFDPLPEDESIFTPYVYEGCTKELLLADHLTVLGYFGDPSFLPTAENNLILTDCYIVSHHEPERCVIEKWAAGVPIPPKNEVVVKPLQATFSQARIEEWAELNPPKKYNGDLAYTAADAGIWEPQVAASIVAMAGDVNWALAFDAQTRYLLAKNMAGKGLPYELPKDTNGSFAQYLGPAGGYLTAAEVLRIADPATLPGVPATA